MTKASEYRRKRRPLGSSFWRPIASFAGAVVGICAGCVMGVWILELNDLVRDLWREASEEPSTTGGIQ